MTHAKRFDLMKWWPLLTFIVSSIAAVAVLFYRVEQLENRQDKQSDWLVRCSQGISDIKERCAKIEGSR